MTPEHAQPVGICLIAKGPVNEQRLLQSVEEAGKEGFFEGYGVSQLRTAASLGTHKDVVKNSSV